MSLHLKKARDGTLHWLAYYSNAYRDDDIPAEIISKASQVDFVRAVDAGEWPVPELWCWHLAGTRFGIAKMVGFDDMRGMAFAAGSIDKGKEHIALAAASYPNLRVSHGMPRDEIRRDGPDKTVITRHRVKEISILPCVSAANKHTGFALEKDMKANKLQFLLDLGFNPDEIQSELDRLAQGAMSENREIKEIKAVNGQGWIKGAGVRLHRAKNQATKARKATRPGNLFVERFASLASPAHLK